MDLRASDDELVREIRHACTTSGFFIGEHQCAAHREFQMRSLEDRMVASSASTPAAQSTHWLGQ